MKLIGKIFQIISQEFQSFLGNFLSRECTHNFSIIMEMLGRC